MEEKVMKDCKVLAFVFTKRRGWQDNKLRESAVGLAKAGKKVLCD